MSGFPTDAALDASAEQRTVVRTDDNILPVTVKQILNMEISSESETTILIDGHKRKQVALVAKIIGRNEEGMNTSYKVTDYTGVINVSHLVNSSDTIEYNVGDYIYICGRISTAKKDGIHAFSVILVTDPNQIAFHYLHALLAHLQVTKGLPSGTMFSSTYAASGPTTTSAAESTEERETRLRDAVVTFIKGCETDNGVSKAEIVSNFESQFSADEISRAIDSANFNGAIYPSDQDQDRYLAV